MTKQAEKGDVLIAKNENGKELKQFLVTETDEKLQAVDYRSLKLQKRDVWGKTAEELLELTGDYVKEIEIKKEPSKIVEWFFEEEKE